MKGSVALMLNPNCSEYILKLKLTKEEKEFALVVAKLMGSKIDEEFLDYNKGVMEMVGTEEVDDYNQIRMIILAKREGIPLSKLKKLAVKLK